MPSHKIATVLLSLLLATTAYANDDFGAVDFCKDISLVANLVMKARQQDRPMSETLPMAKNRMKSWGDKYGLEMDMDQAEEMAAEMVMAAYEEMISTDAYKKQSATEFENAFFKECYTEMTSDSEGIGDRSVEIEHQRAENERLRLEAEAGRQAEIDADRELPRILAEMDYIFAIQQKIVRNWVRPPTTIAGLECIVNVRQLPGGEVVSVNIGECNGDSTVRRSIEAAVHKASPLPAPSDPSVFDRNLRLEFRPTD